MALIKCEECGKEISSSAKKCPHCGIEREKTEYSCSECGKSINENDKICSNCGYEIKEETRGGSNIINESLDKITGAKVEKYVSFIDLIKNTFAKHTEQEADEIFTCGSDKTTPDIKSINPRKASAWIYMKVLLFMLVSFIITYIGYVNYNNVNFLPGFVILGAFAVPLTVLMFFFEINLFKNIPFYQVIKMFILGGCLSLICAILFFDLYTFQGNNGLTTWDAIMVGLIEEAAKATIVAIFIFKTKKANYILNGLLIGAAVGAGFAAFETAGYILKYGMSGGLKIMMEVLELRAILAPGGHVAWAAIAGGALMYVKGFEKINKKHLNDSRFLLMLIIPIGLHAIWDMQFISTFPYESGRIILTVLAWLVVIYYINLGLKQVEEAKKKNREG